MDCNGKENTGPAIAMTFVLFLVTWMVMEFKRY